MIHTATLVHDDVIDMAKTRRGRPSINVVWGNHTSVLAGDWLYMQAFQVALRERQFALLDILISLTQKMVEGELLQLDRIGKIGVTETDYMELIDRKTASLFAACARLGAVCGQGGDENEAKLADYAWNLGIAFQLVDDILDFTSREKILGKPVGNDLREGKVTLPLIYALESADPEERKLVETVLADGNYDQVPFSKILHMLNRYNAIERAQQRAREFTDRARAIIGGFPASPFQKALISVTGLVTDRDH
jgi:octaprenyl-diphosphate synthase